MKDNRIVHIILLLGIAAILRFGVFRFLAKDYAVWLRIIATLIILISGAAFVLKGAAEVIEETTDVLSQRTKLAGGVLQSLGTAFPDMVLGIVAALTSLSLRQSDYNLAVSYAIMAAATTFGSNIYNIAHAAWCVLRQNLADKKKTAILMFPLWTKGGTVKPISEHSLKPSLIELDTAIDILNALTALTAAVAVSMVLFGRISNPPESISGDLYQLIKPAGVVIFVLCLLIMYHFRRTQRAITSDTEKAEEKKYYSQKPNWIMWGHLLISGLAILLAAETMVHAVLVFCEITGLQVVIAGVLAGVIGCLGEMLVVHNYSVNPKGRIADALVGVAMDNIVTTMGASMVAILGGIFLGGNALILIFVIILTLNTVLIWQISHLKNSLM
jgi:Ca2+/Na+ antiporter